MLIHDKITKRREKMELWMIILIIVVAVIFVFFLVASGIRFYANSITTWFNIRKIRFEGTIPDHTRALLDSNGLNDVQVRKKGFFSSMFVGNTYKISEKVIRLSWLTAKRATPTNLAIACKLVALAKLHRENIKGIGSVAVNRWTSGLPILFLPLIVVGLIVDLISSGKIGAATLILSVIAFVILLISLIISIVSLRVECKALEEGENILLMTGQLGAQEGEKIGKLFSAWKKLYVINTILNAFELIYVILLIFFSIVKGIFRK